MNGAELKAKLRAGQFLRGAWVTIPTTPVIDVMAHAGYDFIILDAEHSPLTVDHIELASVLFRHTSTTPIVRVGFNDQVEIKRTLDAGAEGLVIPMVNTAEEARRAVSYSKYPPQGVRGVAPRAAAQFGRDADYIKTANDRVIVMPQVEHIDSVNNVDEILKVPGIDALFVGPSDLSASMGLLGQPNHPEVTKVIDGVIAKATKAGVACITVSTSPEQAVSHAKRGFQMVTLGGDLGFMNISARDHLTRVPADSFVRAR